MLMYKNCDLNPIKNKFIRLAGGLKSTSTTPHTVSQAGQGSRVSLQVMPMGDLVVAALASPLSEHCKDFSFSKIHGVIGEFHNFLM